MDNAEKLGGRCITVWVDADLEEDFTEEVKKIGLNRSLVMRQLIKRWLIQRRHAKRKEPIEELV
jgi:predicted DNA-binding ribbon-helix-helix protein